MKLKLLFIEITAKFQNCFGEKSCEITQQSAHLQNLCEVSKFTSQAHYHRNTCIPLQTSLSGRTIIFLLSFILFPSYTFYKPPQPRSPHTFSATVAISMGWERNGNPELRVELLPSLAGLKQRSCFTCPAELVFLQMCPPGEVLQVGPVVSPT